MGNGAQFNVICGNSTAEILGKVLIPLLIWLEVEYFMEQPVGAPDYIQSPRERSHVPDMKLSQNV